MAKFTVRFSGVLPVEDPFEKIKADAAKMGCEVEEVDREYCFALPEVFKTAPETPVHKMYPDVTLAVIVAHFVDALAAVLGRELEGTVSELVDILNSTSIRVRGVRVVPRMEGVQVSPVEIVFVEEAEGKGKRRLTIVNEGSIEEAFYLPDSKDRRFRETEVTTLVSRGRYGSGFEHLDVNKKPTTRLVRIKSDVEEVNKGVYLDFDRECVVTIESDDKHLAAAAFGKVREFVNSIPGMKIAQPGVAKLFHRFGGSITSRSFPPAAMVALGVGLIVFGFYIDTTTIRNAGFASLFSLMGGSMVLATEFFRYIGRLFKSNRQRNRQSELEQKTP